MKMTKKINKINNNINIIAMVNNMEKFVKVSPMNIPEEGKCYGCERILFEKELFMQCQTKGQKGELYQRTFCCDCFKTKIEEDVKRINNWSRKTTEELYDMLIPILEYMSSETKKQLDSNKKMLDKIESEGGL